MADNKVNFMTETNDFLGRDVRPEELGVHREIFPKHIPFRKQDFGRKLTPGSETEAAGSKDLSQITSAEDFVPKLF